MADLNAIGLCHTADPKREVMPLALPASGAVDLDATETFAISHLLYGRCSFTDPNADEHVRVVVVPADGIEGAKDTHEPLFTAVAHLNQCVPPAHSPRPSDR